MNAFRPAVALYSLSRAWGLPLLLAGLLCLPAQAAPQERCGNGRVEQNRGEVCDDGNTTSGDGCSADCRSLEYCSNGVVDTARGELCDDGNTVNGDGCSSDCRSLEACGDGTVNPASEQCDDANLANDDGCSTACTFSC